MERKVYEVRGMSCGGCAAAVTRAIQAADADAEVEVELDAAQVAVTSMLTSDAVRDAVERAGFEFHGIRQPG